MDMHYTLCQKITPTNFWMWYPTDHQGNLKIQKSELKTDKTSFNCHCVLHILIYLLECAYDLNRCKQSTNYTPRYCTRLKD